MAISALTIYCDRCCLCSAAVVPQQQYVPSLPQQSTNKIFGVGLSCTGTEAIREALVRLQIMPLVHADHTFAPFLASDLATYPYSGL